MASHIQILECWGREDLYGVLQVDHYATGTEIRRSFQQIALIVHPDKLTEFDEETVSKCKTFDVALQTRDI